MTMKFKYSDFIRGNCTPCPRFVIFCMFLCHHEEKCTFYAWIWQKGDSKSKGMICIFYRSMNLSCGMVQGNFQNSLRGNCTPCPRFVIFCVFPCHREVKYTFYAWIQGRNREIFLGGGGQSHFSQFFPDVKSLLLIFPKVILAFSRLKFPFW